MEGHPRRPRGSSWGGRTPGYLRMMEGWVHAECSDYLGTGERGHWRMQEVWPVGAAQRGSTAACRHVLSRWVRPVVCRDLWPLNPQNNHVRARLALMLLHDSDEIVQEPERNHSPKIADHPHHDSRAFREKLLVPDSQGVRQSAFAGPRKGGCPCPPSEFQSLVCRYFGTFPCRCRNFNMTSWPSSEENFTRLQSHTSGTAEQVLEWGGLSRPALSILKLGGCGGMLPRATF